MAVLGKSSLHACPPATIHLTATSKYTPCSPEPLKSHPLGIRFRARILSSDSVQLLVWLSLHLKVCERKKRGTCSPHTHHTRVRQTGDNCCIPQLLLFRTVVSFKRMAFHSSLDLWTDLVVLGCVPDLSGLSDILTFCL